LEPLFTVTPRGRLLELARRERWLRDGHHNVGRHLGTKSISRPVVPDRSMLSCLHDSSAVLAENLQTQPRPVVALMGELQAVMACMTPLT
jgi:hypothetical protein